MVEPLIDALDAAEILNIHPVTLRKMAARHEIPAIKIGRVWRFQASALADWVNRGLQSSMPPVSA